MPHPHVHGTHSHDPSDAHLKARSSFRLDRIDFDARPILVFWESTRACLLSCQHCRAEAIDKALPGEFTTGEARSFIDELPSFGKPSPVLIITGGDAFMRDDLIELVGHARERGLPVALSPSISPRLTEEVLTGVRDLGVKTLSISVDGASPAVHDSIRGIPGHFEQTVEALRSLVDMGFTIQVNTTVMKDNMAEMADVLKVLLDTGVLIWEVFFLVHVGRGSDVRELSAHEHEDVVHFLHDASRYGILVRTVEAPFFRRVVTWRSEDGPEVDTATEYGLSPLYASLRTRLLERAGPPATPPRIRTSGTRDGKGIIFVGYEGTVYPAGFLPVPLGNVKQQSLVDIYRNTPLLRSIRAASFGGRCGECEFADLCGGSRARAFASQGDPLAEDPACAYTPNAGRHFLTSELGSQISD